MRPLDDDATDDGGGLPLKVLLLLPEKKGGPGVRLGVAYQLPDGSVVYVPESAGGEKPSPVR